MTDLNSLVQKLQALAADDAAFVSGARVICDDGVPAPLTAILTEIDTHVLERELTFDIDGATLRIVVAGRRLRGVLGAQDIPDDVLGKVVSHDDPETLEKIGIYLQRLCQDARRVTLRSAVAPKFGKPSEPGVPAKALAQIWQHRSAAPTPSAMVRFLSSNATAVTDFLLIHDDKIVTTKGDDALLDTIWHDQAQGLRSQQKAIFPQHDGAVLICLDTGAEQSRAPAIAVIGLETAVFCYRPAQLSQILANWQMVTN